MHRLTHRCEQLSQNIRESASATIQEVATAINETGKIPGAKQI